MFGAIAGGIASALAGGAMSKLFGGGQKAASGDRKSGSAGMPRPISYAVFCLKKKNRKESINALWHGTESSTATLTTCCRSHCSEKQGRCDARSPTSTCP